MAIASVAGFSYHGGVKMNPCSIRLAPLAGVVVALFINLAPGLAAEPFPEFSALPAQSALPDPLQRVSGEKVTTKKQWFEQRRPELQALFQHYMYGAIPPVPASVQFLIGRVDPNYFGGKATKKEVTISFGNPSFAPLSLLVVTPNGRPARAPVFLAMNFCGNHALVNDPVLPLSTAWVYDSCKGCANHRATEASRGAEAQNWPLQTLIERGYGFATFYSGDVVPDRPEAIFEARAQLDPPKAGRTNDFGAIAAWAWGFHRCVDYLVRDPDVNPQRIIAVGHSRNGKTALLAAAFDERMAAVIPVQAGCGGTSPNRGKIGESVKRINTAFPHWFNAQFKTFNEQPDRLPFDQHCLIALCAPRPVLLANAVEDQWANPSGQFEMLQAAQSVYGLTGGGKLKAKAMPAVSQLSDGGLGYYIRPGKHSMTADDWRVFLRYADAQFGQPK